MQRNGKNMCFFPRLSDENNLYENCPIRFSDEKSLSEKPPANIETMNQNKLLYISLHEAK